MRNFRAHVNLIPYNPIGPGVSGITYSRPSEDRIRVFMNILRSRGVVTHIRVPRGDNVNAACGQLRETVAAENAI
jgi:23S rRNA (adenine2503-C2)-methyltransferase